MTARRPTVVSYPGVMAHAQQCALAFEEAGELQAFVTTLAFSESDALLRALATVQAGWARRLQGELRRRLVHAVPAQRLVRYPWRELLRTLGARAGLPSRHVDRLWNRMAIEFDQQVARRHVPTAGRVYAFEYTALESLRRARALGIQAVLDLPSLDSLEQEHRLAADTQGQGPDEEADQPYFDALFARRYERRQQEIALADVIIANSRLTAESHVRAGADPARMRVVPLAGPPPVARVHMPDPHAPLQVLWASGITPRKGAHHFLQALRRLGDAAPVRTQMYGGLRMPSAMLQSLPAGIEFRGAVPQPRLFAAMARADVLVFPTLSDGFGAVVSEALALGVPVIVSDRAGAADRITHGVNGFVFAAGDVDALHRLLQWCLDERQALAGMRAAAHACAGQWQWSHYRDAIRKACA